MKINEVINESVLFCGITISERLQYRLNALFHNKDIFNKFKKIIIVINCEFLGNKNQYISLNEYGEKDINEIVGNIKDIFKDKVIILINPINRGWQFGVIDLDKAAFDYARLNFPLVKYYFRIAPDDTKLYNNFLEIDLQENVDFYGLPFMKEWVSKLIITRYYNKEFLKLLYDSAKNPFEGHIIFFQAQQYIIKNTNKIDSLFESNNFINKLYKIWSKNNKHDNSTVDWKFGVEIEKFISNMIVRCQLNAKYLFSLEEYIYFINTYVKCKTKGLPFDIALRNILLEDLGIMHYHPATLTNIYQPSTINCKQKTFNYSKQLR